MKHVEDGDGVTNRSCVSNLENILKLCGLKTEVILL